MKDKCEVKFNYNTESIIGKLINLIRKNLLKIQNWFNSVVNNTLKLYKMLKFFTQITKNIQLPTLKTLVEIIVKHRSYLDHHLM